MSSTAFPLLLSVGEKTCQNALSRVYVEKWAKREELWRDAMQQEHLGQM